MDGGEAEYCFLWLVENYSYSQQWLTECLVSPDFAPQGLRGSTWYIRLYPGFLKRKNSPYNSLQLQRSIDDTGQENLSLKLEVSIIAADGSTLYSEECEHTFRKRGVRLFKAYVDMDEFSVRRNTEFLARDTLGVRCRMWRGERTARSVTQWTTRTRIRIKKISFIHRVEKFSGLKPNDRKTIQIPSQSKKGCVFASIVYISNIEETVNVEIVPSVRDDRIWNMKLSLLDVFGNTVEIGEVDYRFDNCEEDLDKLKRRFTKQFFFDKRREYLPNDELSLLCECTFTTPGACDVFEETVFEIPMGEYNRRYHNSYSTNDRSIPQKISAHPSASEDSKVHHNAQSVTDEMLKSKTFRKYCNAPSTSSFVQFSHKTNNDLARGKYNSAEKPSKYSSVQDDLKALYNDQLLTDVALKTATKSFPAHKTVLCVRSSVFCAMLTTDMRERNTDCTRVDDLDEETLRRLLLFLYSDHLEELRWESALGLYYAADKYAIERLKVLCSSFLLDNLSTSNASELLLLADTHSDAELKQLVEDFILEHCNEIFNSDQWIKLSETNPQLVIKTMQLKFKS